MNANNIIINREYALSLLNAAEKRCSARTFDDLETVEEALKDLLAENGYAKTCNRKLKGIRAIVGETTGENHWVKYSRKHRYPNSNQTTWVVLAHNGKGWKLIKAERDYTDKCSSIDKSNTKEEIEKRKAAEEAKKAAEKAEQELELAIEEAKKQLADYLRSRISSLTLADVEGVDRVSDRLGGTLAAVVKAVIEKEKGYACVQTSYEKLGFNGSTVPMLWVHYYSKDLNRGISATIPLPEENLFCENCENCKWCYFCTNCKDCTECADCSDCKNCTKSEACEECEDCVGCSDCKVCKTCENCSKCEKCEKCRKGYGSNDCTGCTDFVNCCECEDCTKCENCENCSECEDAHGVCRNCMRCRKIVDCESCTDCKHAESCMNCTRINALYTPSKNCNDCTDCFHCLNCTGCKDCNTCNECNDCEKCECCYNCNECEDCKYCEDYVNQSNVTFRWFQSGRSIIGWC